MRQCIARVIGIIVMGLWVTAIPYPVLAADSDTSTYDDDDTYTGIDAIRHSDNALWGAIGGSYFDYRETDDRGATADTERGGMPSIAGGVSVLGGGKYSPLLPNLYLALEGDGSFGSVHYKGSLQDGTPYQGSTDESIWDIDGRVGRALPLGNNFMFIPFGELGFRYWDRNLGGGYIEDYQNFDILAGLMGQYAPNPRLIFSLSAAGGTTFAASMTATEPTMNFNLGSEPMFKLGGKIGYELTPRVELFTSLDYLQLRYGQSQNVLNPYNGFYYYEPNSQTEQTTMRVGIAYHFE